MKKLIAALGIGISLVALYLALRDIHFDQVAAAFGRINPAIFALAVLPWLVAIASKVLRWRLLYHPDEAVFLEYFAHGQTDNVTALTGFPRLCLHACAMEFTHPGTGRREIVESDLPPDLQGFWDTL